MELKSKTFKDLSFIGVILIDDERSFDILDLHFKMKSLFHLGSVTVGFNNFNLGKFIH